MADSFHEEVLEDAPANPSTGDLEMTEGGYDDSAAAAATANGSELPFAESGPDDPPAPRVGFLQYLSSPIVTLLIGGGDTETVLTAHQGLLTQSTFFAEACADFADDGSASLSFFTSLTSG